MVYILLGEGFEEIEAVAPCDILRRGGVSVCFAAVGTQKTVPGSHGITILADTLISEISLTNDDMLVIPGGMGGVRSISSDQKAMELIAKGAKNGVFLAAICAGPSVLASLGLTDGKRITCFPGCENLMGAAICETTHATITEAGLITGRAAGSAIDFGLELLKHIKGESASKRTRMEIIY